jgi:uncharacterized membrane protein
MIETLLLTFARSMVWSFGKHASRKVGRWTRRLGWWVWCAVIVAGVVVALRYGGVNLWINSLRSWLQLSAGLLPRR